MGSSAENHLIAKRYALALFEMAQSAKAVDVVHADMDKLKALSEESRDFNTLLTSPLIGRKQGADALAAILEKGKANKITTQFLATLAENRRLELLSAVAERFAELVEESRGEITADVESATPVPDDVQKQVVTALAKSTGKKVKLRLSQNPSLLGGMVVRFSGKRLDLSVAGRLDRLSQSLRRA